MLKHYLFYIILLSIYAVSITAYGQDCYSYLTVSVVSTETTSLEGFSIKLDGRNIGATDDYGYLSIPLAGIPRGKHRIQAAKQEGDSRFEGSQPIDIPCINASAEAEYYVTVDVFYAQQSPWRLMQN